MQEFIRAGSLAEIPEGEMRAFELPHVRVCIAHAGPDVFVFSDECTHRGCSLSEEGQLVDDEFVECGCHEARFDLASGEPVSGPAVDRLPTYQVRISDDWVEVGPENEE
jgi:3-phenylpropionate/trans-cinnamate dioxygenase ferredoxin component